MLLTAGQLNWEKLAAGDSAGKPFATIAVGTSNTPETITDSAITGAITKAITTIDYLTGGYVQFNTTLVSGDASIVIQEVGLFNSAGTLCYRKVIPAFTRVTGSNNTISYKIKVQ